jgi:hypothetical protein
LAAVHRKEANGFSQALVSEMKNIVFKPPSKSPIRRRNVRALLFELRYIRKDLAFDLETQGEEWSFPDDIRQLSRVAV